MTTYKYHLKIISKEKSYYIVKDKNESKYLIYLDEDLPSGSMLHVNGSITRLKNTTIPLVFNFASYLSNKGVHGQIIVTDYEVTYKHVRLKDNIINYLLRNISIKSAGFIKLLMFGEKSILTDAIYENLIGISAIHLFIVSGFHLNSLKNILSKILKPLVRKKNIINVVVLCVLLFYLYCLILVSQRQIILFIF